MTAVEVKAHAVIAGLDPAIHHSRKMDARVIRREDGASRLLPAHDAPK
jgi:hypothetical protein